MDFKETLKIKTHKDQFGRPSCIGWYEYAITKEDLSDNTFQIIESDDMLTLGEACNIIDRFTSSSLKGRKLAIRAFLEKDEYEHIEEY